MRPTPSDFRAAQGKLALTVKNMVRRVLITAIDAGRAAIEGYLQGDDSYEGANDVEGIDSFQGMYVYAKPGAGDDAEGVMLHVGGHAEHRVLVAQRNEEARQRYVEEHGDIAAGEWAVFESGGAARVLLKADKSIELTPGAGQNVVVKRKGGVATAVATVADVQAIVDAITNSATGGADGGATYKTNMAAALTKIPVGTDAFEAE